MAATAKGDATGGGTAKAETATLILEGKSYELPVVRGTEGEKAIDITSLRKATGYVTLDRGYENTGSCRSAITFIDGEKGILRYRGYPIEDLAEKSTFTEVAYLLLYGELPTQHAARGVLDVPQRVLADPRGHAALLRRLSRAARTPWASSPRRSPRSPPSTRSPSVLDEQGRAPDPRQPDLAGAHHRGDLVQEVHRRADRLPLVQAALRAELPEHDVLLAGEGLPRSTTTSCGPSTCS